MISPQGKPWVTPCKTLSPRQPAGVFHLSISKNPETGKILKMQSGKQSLTTIPQGKKMIMGFQRHESPRSVQRAEPGRQPQLTCAAEQTDLSVETALAWWELPSFDGRLLASRGAYHGLSYIFQWGRCLLSGLVLHIPALMGTPSDRLF